MEKVTDPQNFAFHEDAAHGWLVVPQQLVNALNIQQKITEYSYINGDLVYLEEDLDVTTFISAYLNHIGKQQNDYKYFRTLITIYYDGERSTIRDYRSYSCN